MLFNLLLANITTLLCLLFLFLVAFNIFFTSPADNENSRLRLALAVTTGVPIIVANDAIEMLPLVVEVLPLVKDLFIFYSLILFL